MDGVTVTNGDIYQFIKKELSLLENGLSLYK